MLIDHSKWITKAWPASPLSPPLLAVATQRAILPPQTGLLSYTTTLALIHILVLFPLSTVARDLLRFHDTLAKRHIRSDRSKTE